MATCLICHRPLTDPVSIERSVCPACWANGRALGEIPRAECLLLGFPFFRDGLVCARLVNGVLACNIPQSHRHHSSAGFEIGYRDGGPADLALNTLALLLPGNEIKLRDGTRVSRAAWYRSRAFERKFIAPMPASGGRILIETLTAWVKESA